LKKQRLVISDNDAPYPETPDQYRCFFQISLLEDSTAQAPPATEYTSHTQIIVCGARSDDGGNIVVHGKRYNTTHPTTRICLIRRGMGVMFAVTCINQNSLISGSLLWKCEFDSKALKELLQEHKGKDVLEVKGHCTTIPCRHDQEEPPSYSATLTLEKERHATYVTGITMTMDKQSFQEYLRFAKY